MRKNEVYNKIKEILTDENFKKEKSDAMALYLLYYLNSKNNLSWIKVPDASEDLQISVHRIRKAKQKLHENGFIDFHSERNPKYNVVEHFVVI